MKLRIPALEMEKKNHSKNVKNQISKCADGKVSVVPKVRTPPFRTMRLSDDMKPNLETASYDSVSDPVTS